MLNMEDDDPPRAGNLALILNSPTRIFELLNLSFHSISISNSEILKFQKVKVLWTR